MDLVPEKPEQPRKLVWLADSLNRLTSFPPSVRQRLGFALYQGQIGQRHESAKMLHGFTETIWQVRADDPSGTIVRCTWHNSRRLFTCSMLFRRRQSRGS